jgi:hypothetical protein
MKTNFYEVLPNLSHRAIHFNLIGAGECSRQMASNDTHRFDDSHILDSMQSGLLFHDSPIQTAAHT